jgi:hypothetical protein
LEADQGRFLSAGRSFQRFCQWGYKLVIVIEEPVYRPVKDSGTVCIDIEMDRSLERPSSFECTEETILLICLRLGRLFARMTIALNL